MAELPAAVGSRWGGLAQGQSPAGARKKCLWHLPPYSPECNPSEHIWDEIREKGFANEFFATLDDVEVRLKTRLEELAADAVKLREMTNFPWVENGLLYV